MTEARIIFGLVALLAILGAFGTYTFHERAVGAKSELTDLQQSSAKLLKEDQVKIDDLTKKYGDATTALEVKTDEADKANAAAHDSDAQRLRDFYTYRDQLSKLQSAAKPASAASNGNSGTGKSEDFIGELGLAGVSLADALRDTVTALNACMIDRNSVTTH